MDESSAIMWRRHRLLSLTLGAWKNATPYEQELDQLVFYMKSRAVLRFKRNTGKCCRVRLIKSYAYNFYRLISFRIFQHRCLLQVKRSRSEELAMERSSRHGNRFLRNVMEKLKLYHDLMIRTNSKLINATRFHLKLARFRFLSRVRKYGSSLHSQAQDHLKASIFCFEHSLHRILYKFKNCRTRKAYFDRLLIRAGLSCDRQCKLKTLRKLFALVSERKASYPVASLLKRRCTIGAYRKCLVLLLRNCAYR